MEPFSDEFLATLPPRLQRSLAQGAAQIYERAKERGQQLFLKFAAEEEKERKRLFNTEQAEDRWKVWHLARLEAGYEPIYPKSEQVRLSWLIIGNTNRALHANSNPPWIVEFLGCSHFDLWTHLESRFKLGMTRENRGSFWEVDHIKPRSSFDLVDTEQYRACAHFSNLQPLTIEEHKLKHATQARYDEKS